MVSIVNSTSCQSTLSSTSPWHTADRIDFLFFRSSSYAFDFFCTASNPFTNLLVLCPKPRLAQKQQHKQQHQQQQQTKQQTIAKPFQNLSGLGAGFWLAAILTRSEINFGRLTPKSPDKVFVSHTRSHSFPNSKTQELSAVEHSRKPRQAAAAGKSKETEEETKGE